MSNLKGIDLDGLGSEVAYDLYECWGYDNSTPTAEINDVLRREYFPHLTNVEFNAVRTAVRDHLKSYTYYDEREAFDGYRF